MANEGRQTERRTGRGGRGRRAVAPDCRPRDAAGLPLAHGLVALGEELPRGRLRRSMNDWPARSSRASRSTRHSWISREQRIPPHLRGLVIAGLRSGRLGDILSRFSAVCRASAPSSSAGCG